MKVILLKDVKSQGRKDDIINVSDGYANNYLIKNKLAVAYTDTSKKILDKQIQIRNDEEAKMVANLTEIKNKLNDKVIEFIVKNRKNDRVFGTVSSKQISDKINELGYDIDKKCILIDTPLSSLGTYKVKIKLHKKVEFNINIKLIK